MSVRSLPGLLSAAPRMVRPTPQTEAEWSRRRDDEQPWRAWYKTARWRKLRKAIIERDRWRCQATGILLNGKHPAPDSAVVDHKIPHHGDEALFWSEANLQLVSKAYHDREKQRLERRAY